MRCEMGLGGNKGGGSAGGVTISPSPYETQLAQIAGDMYQQTSPLRSSFLRDYGLLMGIPSYYGGTTPTAGTGGNYGTTGATYNPANYTAYTGYTPTSVSQGIDKTGTADPFTQLMGGRPEAYQTSAGLPVAFAGMQPLYQIGGQLYSQIDTSGNPWQSPTRGVSLGDPFTYQNQGQPIWQPYVGDTAGLTYASGYTGAGSSGTGTGTQGGGMGTGTQAGMPGSYDPRIIPTYSPLYNAARSGLESQYDVARQQILGGTARGGAQTAALSSLDRGRAYDVGSLQSQITGSLVQDMINKAYGVAWSTPQTSMSGLGTASTTYGSRSNTATAVAAQQALAQQQQTNTAMTGIGSAIGMGVGKGLTK